jgi:hypothetical protein
MFNYIYWGGGGGLNFHTLGRDTSFDVLMDILNLLYLHHRLL